MHGRVRIADEGDLRNGPRAVDNSATAQGWWTVAYVVPVKRLRKVSDGVDDEGKPIAHMETVEETNLVVRGWRGDSAFLAAWSADGKADVAYWWTRDHEAWAELPRQLVTWTTPTPTPVKVPFARLKTLLKNS